MLKYMRQQAGSWGIKTLFIILVLAFISWGGGGLSDFFTEKKDLAATINGTLIHKKDYEAKAMTGLRNYRYQYRQILQKDITPQMELEYKKSLLERMIERELMLQTADRMGLSISPAAVKESIKKDENFFDKDSKVFSLSLYLDLLRANQMTPEKFEFEKSKDLLLEELKTLIQGFSKVSENEVYEEYLKNNEQVNLAFVGLSAKDFVDKVQIDEQTAKASYDQDPSKFMSEEQRKISYVAISPQNLSGEVEEPVESEIKKEFNDNYKDSKEEPEQAHARHILLKSTPDKDEATLKAKADELSKKLSQGADFATLAQENSEDLQSAKNGGDLGYFPRNSMVKSFEDKVFSMKDGEISEPVKTQFGYHIIQLLDRKPGKKASLEQYRDEIAHTLKLGKATNLAKEKLNNLRNELLASPQTFDDKTRAMGLSIATTDFFTSSAKLNSIPDENTLRSTAFNLGSVDTFSSPQTGDSKNIYLIRLDAIEPPGQLTFEEARATIEQQLKQDKAAALAKTEIEKLVRMRKENPALVIEEFPVKATGPFYYKKMSYTPQIGIVEGLKEKVKDLSMEKPLIEQALESNGTYYCIWLKELFPADMKAYEDKKDQVTSNLLIEKRNQYFQSWKDELKRKAKIERHYEFTE